MSLRNFARHKSLRIEQLEHRALLAADVYISEIGASNSDVILDEDGSSADWIEITNAGPDAVDLSGWHLTDDADELNKWSFPSQQLAPGSVLLVYASDKDRADAGSQLHTNFKLSAGGEYLGLTRTTGDTVEVVSAFSPEFPAQLNDISYGFGQSVDQNIVSSGDASAKLFFPADDALGTSWTEVGFDDAAWTEATAGVGYQNIVPGFTVQDAKATGRIVNLAEALAVLDGEGQESSTTVISPTINFTDDSFGGFFEGDQPFPNSTGNGDDDFAVRATGVIDLPRSGNWYFGFVSDDGGRLSIDGEVLASADVLRAPDASLGFGEFAAGEHEIEIIYFERGGGAELEVFAGHELDEQARIIGDLENGGLPVFTSGGGAGGVSDLFDTEIGEAMQGVSSDAYLRVPFEVADPSALESLTMRMNYDDGFIAYLNGTEVARSNAPDGAAANATATATRPRGAAETTETLDLTPFLSQLNAGQNVLAVHGLNNAVDDNSFLIRAELAEVKVSKGDVFYFKSPTPGDFNPETGVAGFLTNEITMSQPHGFYEEAIQVELSAATEGTTIHYTLDGSEPTAETGAEYTEPITIDKTTTVRARAFKDGVDPSFVETRTYLFLADVVQQTRTTATDLGFPTSAGGQTYNYGMDPDIVEDEVWGPQLREALTQIPTMSLVMNVDDFADRSTGIYSNAQSHGKAWERPASLELINPDGSEGFQVNMGVRVRGGFSRSGSNPKHAFRFFFRDEYGDSKLEFPLFGDEGAAEFDKIDLRTSQNYSWSFQGDSRNSFVRDVFSRDLQREMDQPYTRSRFYHLYINGQYWGLFQTQERAEANFAASYFGGNSDDYDVIKSAGSSGGYANEATDGNMEAYLRLANAFRDNGLSDANYEAYMRIQGKNLDGTRNPDFERLLDVENLIDYMIITYYTGDRDGPASRFVQPRVNNYFAIINRENPDGFKFFEHDSEHSLDTGENNMVSPLTFGGQFDEYFNPHWMHEQLAQENSDYRTQFNDRVYEVLFNNGLLTPGNAKDLIDSRAAQIDMAIIAESARWGDSKVSQPYTKDNWETAVTSAKRFTERRTLTLLGQLRAVDWYPDADAPGYTVNGTNQHGGAIRPNDILAFDDAASLDFGKRFIRESSSWDRLDDGSDAGTAWRNNDFDDSEWSASRGPVGYGDGDERSETSFGDDPNDKHVTTYFRKTFTALDIGQYKSLRLSLLSDDGAVVYLNGTEVIRANMPDGEISFDTPASTKKEDGENNFTDYLLPADLLVEGSNLVAVEVHQFANADGKVSDDDMSFDIQLYGGTELEGEPTEIYFTTDGSDPRLSQGVLNPMAIKYGDGFQLDKTSEVRARAKNGDAWGVLTVANFEVHESPGDLNDDGALTADDIDFLAASIRNNSVDPRFDLNNDNEIDENDLNYIVESIFNTRAGDTNLDGDVDFADFLVLSTNFGQANTGWAQGSFGAEDTDTTFADFLALSANFGFERPITED